MKKYLIAGLIILLPLALTVLVIIFIVDLFTSPFLSLVTNFLLQFKQALPILQNPTLVKVIARTIILLLLCGFIFLLGLFTRWFFFKGLLNVTNKVLSKIPFVKSIYKSLRDITSSFITQGERKAFKHTTMVAFPSESAYCVGFESGDTPKECEEKTGKKLKPVFLPTAPHPISGYMVLVPEDKIHPIDMSNEDAVKFTVSCGLILPGEEIKKDENK